MRKKYWCILILIILTTSCTLFAWGPVGHYAIARESGITHDKAGLYNLPDAWDSWALIVVNLNEPNANIFEITDFFCWSHAVARNPKSWSFYGIVPVRVPSIPEYHLEREPGQIIQAFIDQNKVARWRTKHGNIPVEKTQANDTAIFSLDTMLLTTMFIGVILVVTVLMVGSLDIKRKKNGLIMPS